jgi:outer membrane protein OmpA-like peptidoglycan-associated protein
MNKKYFLSGSKITALLFIVFSFKSISYAGIENEDISTIFDQGFKNKNPADTGKIVISGIIKDGNGNPLENTRILFDTVTVATTDENGTFSFEPVTVTPSIHNIYFSRDSFATVVRTYYPVMLSANYNVVLYRQINSNTAKPVSIQPVHAEHKDTIQVVQNKILPIIKPTVKADTVVTIKKDLSNTTTTTTVAAAAELDFPSIIFKINATALTAQSKAFLDIVSEKLRDNPTIKIDIKANTPVHDYNPTIAQKRLANIVRYLVANGIAADRLNKITVTGGGEVNTIDFVNSKE